MGDKIVSIQEDKTEVKMYRDSTLNDENFGVAILQDGKFVELNEKYAKYVHKTREQMLGSEYSLKGMSPETRERVKREIQLLTQQKKVSYKVPLSCRTEFFNARSLCEEITSMTASASDRSILPLRKALCVYSPG